MNFVGTWTADESSVDVLQPGGQVVGTGVSAGIGKGRVRLVTMDTLDDLESGEVLVAEFTDVGWTPFFSIAAAVVVNTGGEMSHAAVVAREFGIPCVVATGIGTEALVDGQWVEVDGAASTVTVLEGR